MIIAWDVDDTLIIPFVATGSTTDTPNYENIAIYRWFQRQGHRMVIWSGGGVQYAQAWADRLGLNPDFVWVKEKRLMDNGEPVVDIAFDDCIVDLAKVNVRVTRVNNEVSREEWNKHERNN